MAVPTVTLQNASTDFGYWKTLYTARDAVAAASKAVYLSGRMITSFIVGGGYGLLHYMYDQQNHSDRELQPLTQYVITHANDRDQRINREPFLAEEPFSRKQLPEIIGGITVNYILCVILFSPILLIFPYSSVIALIINAPYLYGVTPYGDDKIDKVFRHIDAPDTAQPDGNDPNNAPDGNNPNDAPDNAEGDEAN